MTRVLSSSVKRSICVWLHPCDVTEAKKYFISTNLKERLAKAYKKNKHNRYKEIEAIGASFAFNDVYSLVVVIKV